MTPSPSPAPTREAETPELRDYFASNAPTPPTWWMDSYAKGAKDLDTVADTIAQWAYVYADAMLKARKA